MKGIIKRITMLLAAGMLLCSMTSCGEEKSTIEIAEEMETEPEYLNFFSVESFEDSDLGKYWSDKFAEKYNQQVYVSYEGAAYYAKEGLSYRELLEKRLESTSPDDLYIINAEDVLEFDRKGYWMDLSGMDFVDNLSDAALYQSTYDGKVFSVPLTFTGFGFYWNKSMLEEHGLTVPGNLKEFLAVCEKLKNAGVLPYGANKGYALTVPAMCKGLRKLYNSPDKEQKIAELNSGDLPISSYMREGYDLLSYMVEKGYIDTQQALDAEPRIDDVELFMNGECAFICVEMGAILKEEEKYDFQRVFTGVPVLEEGCAAVYGAVSRLCVNPDSKYLDTALKFVEMVGTREALDESAELQNKMSSAKGSNLTTSPVQQEMFELLQQPGQIPNQDFALHFNTWESIRDVGREVCNGITVEEACEKIDELQRTDLEKYSRSK